MRRYYISQRFCITLCVGITFRNVYYIMRFNTRGLSCHCSSSLGDQWYANDGQTSPLTWAVSSLDLGDSEDGWLQGDSVNSFTSRSWHECRSPDQPPAGPAFKPGHNSKPGCCQKSFKRCVLRMLLRHLLYNVNDMRALTGISLGDVTLTLD